MLIFFITIYCQNHDIRFVKISSFSYFIIFIYYCFRPNIFLRYSQLAGIIEGSFEVNYTVNLIEKISPKCRNTDLNAQL